MSQVDRDWYREGDAGPRGWGGTPASWALIALHLGAWALLTGTVALEALGSLALRADDVLHRGRVQELATYAIAWGDGSPLDLLWTLACLLVFGREVEARTGARRMLVFYGVAVLLVGVAALLISALPFSSGVLAGGVGPGVALLVGHAVARPYASVIGVPIPIAAIALVALPASQHLVLARDPTWSAHLFGVVVGFVYARRGLLDRRAPVDVETARGEFDPTKDPPSAPASNPEGVKARVDALLAKIQREGLASLTGDERSYLQRVSRKFRDP